MEPWLGPVILMEVILPADPHSPEDFAATIYRALGIPQGAHWEDLTGRPHPIYHGNPINKLFS